MKTVTALLQAMLLAVVVVSLAGCLDETVPSAAPTDRPTPEPTPVTTVYELGSTVWYAVLDNTYYRAKATLDERRVPVDEIMGLENTGADPVLFDAGITIFVGGKSVELTRDSQIPEVPAGGTAATVLTFELQAIPSVDDAIIEIGAAPQHVGQVPLTPQAGAVVAFEPTPVAMSGSATAASLKVAVLGGILRWDLPDWSEELDADLQALTVTYDVTYVGDFAGGLPFTGENIKLRLPDGSMIGARRDGHSQSVELVGANKTKKGLFSRFEIPAGLTGSFALVVINSGTQKTIAFTIGG
jgi:hypothetical protein